MGPNTPAAFTRIPTGGQSGGDAIDALGMGAGFVLGVGLVPDDGRVHGV